VDGVGRTSLDGLWACGEVAGTGAHGASRLAGNALLEAVVFAARVAEDIHGLLPNPKLVPRSHAAPEGSPRDEEDREAMRRLRAAMSRYVGVVRDRDGLTAALGTIQDLLARAQSPQLVNACTAAKLMAAAALRREESRGAHLRSDFPRPDPALARRAYLRLREADGIAGTARAGERMTA
jgi:L-aspartate oxidase